MRALPGTECNLENRGVCEVENFEVWSCFTKRVRREWHGHRCRPNSSSPDPASTPSRYPRSRYRFERQSPRFHDIIEGSERSDFRESEAHRVDRGLGVSDVNATTEWRIVSHVRLLHTRSCPKPVRTHILTRRVDIVYTNAHSHMHIHFWKLKRESWNLGRLVFPRVVVVVVYLWSQKE